MIRVFALAVVAAVFSAPAHAAINLLTNGDFESGVHGSLPTGWNATTSASGQILVLRGSDYIPCCGTFGSAANLKNSFASFGAGDLDTTRAVLGQSFATVAGMSYDFSFDWGALGSGTPNTVTAMIDGTPISALISANNNLDTTLSTVAGSFVASSNLSTIKFYVSGPTYSIDPIIDNVSVSSAVPEPSTWAMMLIGFVGLGLMSRKRRIEATA